MNLVLRPVLPEELAAVGALHHRSRLSAYRDLVGPQALSTFNGDSLSRWWIERWSYEHTDHVLTIAERDGRLIGFTYFGPDDLADSQVGMLFAIHVEPAEQGTGVGRRLMREALAAMRRSGWRRAALWVYAGNRRARQFYERGGWLATEVEREEFLGTERQRQVRYVRPLASEADARRR